MTLSCLLVYPRSKGYLEQVYLEIRYTGYTDIYTYSSRYTEICQNSIEWAQILIRNWKMKSKMKKKYWYFVLLGSYLLRFTWLMLIPTNCWRGFPFSTPFPAFFVCRYFNDVHSYGCEVILHCSFDLHFFCSEQFWTSFHVFISHLYVLFGEIAV